MSRFFNLLFHQLGWFACVLGAAWGFSWLGVSFALCLVGVHLWLAADWRLQLKLCLTAAALGLVIDTGQLRAGVFAFPRGTVVDWLPPPFMTVLWLQFATTFRYGMSWLSGRYVLCSVFGLLGAPLAFFAGERLGAIEFLAPRLAHFAVLGTLWAGCVPLLVFLSDRWAANDAVAPHYRSRR